jgi:hypothetical protein
MKIITINIARIKNNIIPSGKITSNSNGELIKFPVN